MSLVHMFDDLGLGIEETFCAFGRHKKIVRLEVEDAAETADIMRAFDP